MTYVTASHEKNLSLESYGTTRPKALGIFLVTIFSSCLLVTDALGSREKK